MFRATFVKVASHMLQIESAITKKEERGGVPLRLEVLNYQLKNDAGGSTFFQKVVFRVSVYRLNVNNEVAVAA